MRLISPNIKLAFSLMGINFLFLPSLFDPTARLVPWTCLGYAFFLAFALISYHENKQRLAFWSQVIGIGFWMIMFLKSL